MSNYRHERGWLDSEVWGDAPYSEREAWSWMIGEANWKPSIRNINGHPVMLDCGQFTASLRFMASKFQWSVGKLQRYLEKLRRWDMIKTDTATDTAQNIITICNYSLYQDIKKKRDTATDTVMDTDVGTDPIQGRVQTRNPSNPSKVLSKDNTIGDSDFQLELEPEPEKPKKKKEPKHEPEKIELPFWLDEKTWCDFLEMRKRIKKPATDRAKELILEKLEKFMHEGHDPNKLLENSILNNWQDIYEPKTTKGTTNGKRSSHDELRDFLDETGNSGFEHDAYLRLR